MPGAGLGHPTLFGRIDNTGSNPYGVGLWTVTFDPQSIAVSDSRFECHRIVISQGPAGSTFRIFVNTSPWDAVTPGDVNSWDPQQPMPLQSGDYVYLYYNSSAAPAPEVTLYFRTLG